MQNIPDKGVSGSLCYLWADYPVTGLTQSLHENQAREREKAAGISHFGTQAGWPRVRATDCPSDYSICAEQPRSGSLTGRWSARASLRDRTRTPVRLARAFQ